MNNIFNDISLSNREGEYVALFKNKAYKINIYFYKLLIFIQNGGNYEDALKGVQIDYSLTEDQKDKVNNSFNGFINDLSNIKNNSSNKKSYIKLQVTLFNENTTRKLSTVFTPLFSKYIIAILFPVSIIINLFFVLFSNGESLNIISDFSLNEIWILFLLSNIFIVFHEIGHSSASLKFNLPSKKIGFGFYLIFPVFFSNVTSIWALRKKERIIVNMGGIYFQLLINVLLISVFYILHNDYVQKMILYLIFSNTFVALYSFIPFLRNDGYWVYSDIFNISNLMAKSDALLFNRNKLIRNIPLLIFTISNWIFRFFILYKLVNYFFKCVQFSLNTLSAFETVKCYGGIVISFIGVYLMISSIYKLVFNNKKIMGGI